MNTTLWIVRFRTRALVARVRRRGFELLVLGPIILGGALWVARRLLADLAEPLRAAATQPLAWGHDPVALLGLWFVLALTLLQLPAVGRELLAPSALGDALDATPTPDESRLGAALLALAARNAVPCLGLKLVVTVLAKSLPTISELVPWALLLAGAAALSALVQVPFALVLARWGGLRGPGLWLAGGLLFGVSWVPGGRWLLLPWSVAGDAVSRVLLDLLTDQDALFRPWLIRAAPTAALLGGLAALVFGLEWRRVRQTLASQVAPGDETPRAPLPEASSWWSRRLPGDPSAKALLLRDLRLVRRRFSVAVPLALVAASGLLLAVAGLVVSGAFPGEAQRRLVVLAGSLVGLVVVTLVPLLLAHQLPRLWMEKSSGVDFAAIAQSKATTARWIVTPWLLAAAGLALLTDQSPLDRWLTAGQTLLAGGMAASVVALAVWEIAAQPILGLVFSGLVGLALAGLVTFYPTAWWLWLIFYLYLAGHIAGRAGRRIRFTEIVR